MNNNYYPIIRAMCITYGLPVPTPEHRFAPPRKWLFDFAWIEYKIALEVEGGVYIQGRHTRPKGFIKDMEKYNRAGALGWTVLRITPSEVKKWATLELVAEVMDNKTLFINEDQQHGKASKKDKASSRD